MADETSERTVPAGEVVAAQDALATEVSQPGRGLTHSLSERMGAVPGRGALR